MRGTILVAVGLFAAVGSVEAKDFVLTARGALGQGQVQAVQAAGGSVYYSHAGTGLVMARSDSPTFARDTQASGAFSQVLEDMVVQWTQPRNVTLVEEAITPGDETFFPIQWAPAAIGAPAAWAAGCTGNSVRVAVIDGGIWDKHVDLNGSVDVAHSVSFVPGFAFNEDVGTFWHATHVAGIIAGRDNGTGIIGIAPEATIVGVKALHSGSGSFGAVIAGILYAATPVAQGGGGADIINMSLGATFPRGGGNTGAGPLVAAMNKAVNYADRFGVLVVSSAGNGDANGVGIDLDHAGSLITVPAESGSGIAIAATGPVGWATGVGADAFNFSRLASYSNFGTSAIQVSAPGGDAAYPGNENCTMPLAGGGSITRPCWVFDLVFSAARGSGGSTTSYAFAAGTSMAAPAVSAVAAIIKQSHPDISLGELKSRIAQTSDDVYKPGADPWSGKGFVNADMACSAR